jgi:branched-chain amino acid transport system substrate-binding protein
MIDYAAKAALSFLLLGGSFASSTSATPRVKVGVILPLSGEFSALGDAFRNGALLASSDLKQDGIDLELRIEDSPSSSAKTSLSAYRKLRVADQASVFFGFVSPEELAAVGPVAEKDGTALVAFVASKIRPKNALLVWMSPEVEAQRLAEKVYQEHTRVAILSADQQWEKDVSDAFTGEFTKLGGEISLRVEVPYASKDVRTEVLKVKQSKATAVVIPP